MEQVKEDKPIIYTYTYSLDGLKFKEWLESKAIKPLCDEGTLAFMAKGIQVVVPWGAKKWDKSAFTLDGEERGEKLALPLTKENVIICVHRDLFKGKEWEIFLDNAQEEQTPAPPVLNKASVVENDMPF